MQTEQLTCKACGGACGHTTNIHRRTLSLPMVRALRFLADHAGRYVHVEEGGKTVDGRTNYGKLAHIWGLALEDSTRNGYWTISPKGWAFLHGELSVQRSFLVGDRNEIRGVADPRYVTAEEIFGEPYDGSRRKAEFEKLRQQQDLKFS